MTIEKNRFKFTVLFIIIQLVSAFIVMYAMNKYVDNKYGFIINLSFYVLVFIAPVFIYIWKVLKSNPFSYLKLYKNSLKGIILGVIISTFIAVIFFIKNRFIIDFNSAKAYAILGLVLAGLFEEIPFRGFYLREFKARIGFWKANIITSFLFAISHFEKIITGDFFQIVILFIIGIWLGFIYEKVKSLWAPIIVHSVFNVLTVLF